MTTQLLKNMIYHRNTFFILHKIQNSQKKNYFHDMHFFLKLGIQSKDRLI